MTGSIILASVVILAWLMWRRRAGRRAADAQERIAGVIAPFPPGGRYPKPSRGHHRESLGSVSALWDLPRICFGCGRVFPGKGRELSGGVILVDLCGACADGQRSLDRVSR